MNLYEIGAKHHTDKSSPNHTHKGLSYLHRYEKHFAAKRLNKNNILELGVLNGNSLMTWHEYFPSSNIIGLDIDPARKYLLQQLDRMEIMIGSQDDKEIRANILSKYKALDIVIDDASHMSDLSIASFNLFWPLLRDNGIYIIEDVSYVDSVDLGRTTWPGQQYNVAGLKNSGKDLQDFILNRISEIQDNANNVFSVDIYQEIIMITKKL